MNSYRAFVLFFLLVVSPARADDGFEPDLAPKTYASPSGRATVRVDPSERSGAGGARYELKVDGKVVWSGEREFTLWNAVVADDGMAAGYAYTAGHNDVFAKGQFLVAMLSPEGAVKIVERVARESSLVMHVMPDPRGQGIFLDPANARFVVRVADHDADDSFESWWSYALADGKALPRIKPQALMPDGNDSGSVMDARPVAATPLTLVHWYLYDSQGHRAGARFTLVDAKGSVVWMLDWPDDYALKDETAAHTLMWRVLKEGAILDTSKPGRFELHRFAGDKRESFAVAADPKAPQGWRVTTLASAAAAPEASPSDAVATQVPVRKLDLVGSITLGAATTKGGAFDDVSAFDLDDRGRFGVVPNCACNGGTPRVVFVDELGRLLRSVELPGPLLLSMHHPRVAWLGGERWLASRDAGAKRTSLFAVDVKSGAVEKLPEIAGEVGAIAADRQGGFVALVDESGNLDMGLVAFDARGRRRWSVGTGMEEGQLFTAEDVTVTPAGEAVVLENIAKKLVFFGTDGKHRATIDLKNAWGREPSYMTEIAADGPAGVVIHDFDGKPPVVRAGLDGVPRRGFAPRYANGGAFVIHGRVLPGRDGRLWTSDGHALVRLDDAGVVDRTVGSPPDTDALGSVEALALGPGPTLHAMDARTGAIHVFDATGTRLRIARPDASDYAGQADGNFTVTGAGEIYAHGEQGFVHYSREGERLGTIKLPLEEVSQHWYAQPGSTRIWVLGYENTYLTERGATIVRTIMRAKDGRWLRGPDAAAVAPDGSIAILLGAVPGYGSEPKPYVAVYDANGEPLSIWDTPANVDYSTQPLAFDGERVALRLRKEESSSLAGIAVFDAQGRPLYRVEPEVHKDAALFLVGSGDARELWVFDGKRSIARYAMP